MKNRLPVAAAAVALTGCETTPIDQMSFKQLQNVAAKIETTRQRYRKSQRAYKLCINRETDREVATRIENRRRAREFAAAAQGMHAMSDNYDRQAGICREQHQLQHVLHWQLANTAALRTMMPTAIVALALVHAPPLMT